MLNQLLQLVQVGGMDAGTFLQGQLTQDVRRLQNEASLLAAWCNPKGRVVTLLRLLEADGDIGLVVPRAMSDAIVKRLSLYRLRAKVTIETVGDDWQCLALAENDDLASLAALDLLPDLRRNASRRAHGLIGVDTGATPRCVEVYGMTADFRASGLEARRPLTPAAWQKTMIDAGIPYISATTSEKYTPHMLNLDCLDAVSFLKGCYTGQEVVARTEHLGRSRRRLAHYRSADGAGPPAIGDKVLDGEQEAGDIVNVSGDDLLAVVPVDLHRQTLTVSSRPLTPVDLPYTLPTMVENEPRTWI